MTVATTPTISVNTQPLLLNVRNTTLTVTPEQFDLLCIDNPDLRLELTPKRELIVMAAIGGGKPSPDVSWVEKSRLEGVDI